ncbi:unnamed protein product [Strongylus vulgaris]|uniref:Cation-transporting P-type ATPase C-terminal domain-containing protein n=1 Tax=Strongylus vulgaris TaxID=40348 RepID=A0A3P7J267_STRVU|nr:unnamed protein product [Strongylus vulgaris]
MEEFGFGEVLNFKHTFSYDEFVNWCFRAHIRTVMVTGDNLLTAQSVARECGIIRPNKLAYLVEHRNDLVDPKGRPLLTLRQLSISGPTFAVITHEYPELLEQLVSVCDVFARMAPDQKQQLINHLQSIDYTVAMCGDGANDCAALKAAHAGISLSDAEASIAAPFTSRIPDIRCVPTVIREGRAALVTSFGVFKYMAGYSLTQFSSIMLLYWISTNLTDFQFLYIDMFLITLVAVFFGNTPARYCTILHDYFSIHHLGADQQQGRTVQETHFLQYAVMCHFSGCDFVIHIHMGDMAAVLEMRARINEACRWLRHRRIRDPQANHEKFERLLFDNGQEPTWLRAYTKPQQAENGKGNGKTIKDQTTRV